MLTTEQIIGLDEAHLVEIDGYRLERRTAKAFHAMATAAQIDGIDLAIASGWRGFSRQLAIFNNKAQGRRPVLDANGHPLNVSQLSNADLLDAILLWSALPGTSRHHWGTDLDVYDKSRITAAALTLEAWEYEEGGPNHILHCWLEAHMHRYGFYRPYQHALGGVAPEPWHLSYWPVSSHCLEKLDVEVLAQTLAESSIELKSALLAQLPALVERYCWQVAQSPQY